MTVQKYILPALAGLLVTGCISTGSAPVPEEEVPEDTLTILWNYAYDLDGGAPGAKPILAGSKIITSGDSKLTALHYSSGELIWKTPFAFNWPLMNDTFGVSKNIITGSVPDNIFSWDMDSGEPVWELHIPDSLDLNQFKGITGTEDYFYAVSSNKYLLQISIEGELQEIKLDARSYESNLFENRIIIGLQLDEKGIVSSYDRNTMELIWRYKPGEFGYPSRAAPIIEEGIVYVGTASGPSGSQNGFFALDARTGQELWRREGIFTYSAVLAGNRIFGVNGQRVWALDKQTGELLWITRGQGHSESNLDYLDGYVYWAHGSGLHVFDGKSGELVHVSPAPDGSSFWLVTAGKGRIFAQSNRALYAFAPWGYKEALEE